MKEKPLLGKVCVGRTAGRVAGVSVGSTALIREKGDGDDNKWKISNLLSQDTK